MEQEERRVACEIYSSWAQGTFLYGKWAAAQGINYYEMLIFYALSAKGELTQKAIGDYCGLPKQTVHNVIRSLEKKGYIFLRPEQKDRREKRVVPTEKGAEYARLLLAPLYRAEEQVCGKIGRERLRQMIDTSELFNLLFERELERNRGNDGA